MSDDEADLRLKDDASLSLPKSAMEKLVKDLLPASVKCTPETRALLTDCCVEFIQMIASEANDLQTKERKKKMLTDHVLAALENLGFSNYIADAKSKLEQQKSGPKRESLATKLRNSGFTPEELAAQQAALFAKAKQNYNLRMSQENLSQASAPPTLLQSTQDKDEMEVEKKGNIIKEEEVEEEIENLEGLIVDVIQITMSPLHSGLSCGEGFDQKSTPEKPTPLIGQKGVQYGLQVPAASKPPVKPASSLFTIDDDDELNVNKRLQLEEAARAQDKKTAKLLEEALAEDPMAFEYDGVYREMKKEEIARKQSNQETGPRKPKYMQQLLKNAELKEKQDMLVLQKRLQRELEAEKEIFGENQEKYITSTYKKQLELNKVYEEELQKKEERDKANTIEGRGNTSVFLMNLLESRSTGREIMTFEQEEELKRGRKRSRSPSPDRQRSSSRERERIARLRERAARDAEEAEKLRRAREEARAKKIAELQEEYSKKVTDEEAAQAARERYLARKKARLEGTNTNTSNNPPASS